MSIPNCPTHNVPMKVSKFGGFYCAAITGEIEGEDGETTPTYCREKVRAPKPSSIAPASSLLPKSGETLAAAALNFSASLCRGSGPEMADEAIEVAIKAYRAMRAVE